MLVLLILLFILFNARGANISNYMQPSSCVLSGVTINGIILVGDSDKVRENLNLMKNKFGEKECVQGQTWLLINSDGGDIDESIKIGRIIRNNNLVVMIPDTATCLSACVLILAGGTSRYVEGKVGIHRPYFSELENGLSSQQIRKKADSLNTKIREYLSEVDIPISLLDAMKVVPPDSMRILTYKELSSFGLTSRDATEDEKSTAEGAKLFNITSAEYRKRRAQVSQTCDKYLDFKRSDLTYSNCADSIILQISMDEVVRRKNRVKSTCNLSNSASHRECYRDIFVFGK